MQCPKCGAQNADNYIFCEKCGTRLQTSEQSPISYQQTAISQQSLEQPQQQPLQPQSQQQPLQLAQPLQPQQQPMQTLGFFQKDPSATNVKNPGAIVGICSSVLAIIALFCPYVVASTTVDNLSKTFWGSPLLPSGMDSFGIAFISPLTFFALCSIGCSIAAVIFYYHEFKQPTRPNRRSFIFATINLVLLFLEIWFCLSIASCFCNISSLASYSSSSSGFEATAGPACFLMFIACVGYIVALCLKPNQSACLPTSTNTNPGAFLG